VLRVSDDVDAVAIAALRRVRSAARAGVGPAPQEHPSRPTDDRDPRLLGEAVRGFMTEHGLDTRHKVTRVLGDWASLVGAEVAEHIRVEEFQEGALVLRADSTAWANQMRLLSATVHRRLDAELGAGVVQSIKVLAPDAPSWKHGNRHIPGRGPRDTYG